MNIRVDLNTSIKDGTEVVFRSPVDCSQVTGLKVYYVGADGNTTSQEFAFADAHGNNVGDIDHLFAENVAVKVILDVTTGMAFVQNADTNAYLEGRFDGVSVDDSAVGNRPWSGKNTVDKLCPNFTESGSAVVCEPVEGYPLNVVSHIVPVQEGSGDPSPDNVRPITGHTGIKLWRGGLNLWDEVWELGNINATGGYNTNATTMIRSKNYTPVKGGVKLSIKAPQMIRVVQYDRDKKCYGSTYPNDGGSVTPSKDGYIRIVAGDFTSGLSVVTEYGKNICISVDNGGTAAYEPYRGETITLDFGQTVYGGSLDWNTGLLTITNKGVALKDLSWEVARNGYFLSATEDCLLGKSAGVTVSCSTYTPSGDYLGIYQNTATNNIICASYYFSNPRCVCVCDTRFGTLDEFTAYLESSGAFLVYPLAEPTTIQLTPQEFLALPGVNTFYGDTGDTEVTGKADPTAVIEKLTNAIITLGGNV